MANSTLSFRTHNSEDNVNAKYGITATDYAVPATVHVDGKPFDIVVLYRHSNADASALNAAAAYAALPNGSMAFCGTATVKIAFKGTADGKTDSAWA
jgi:hypothetical protein